MSPFEVLLWMLLGGAGLVFAIFALGALLCVVLIVSEYVKRYL